MKITAFNGSPRGKNGNTHVMVEEFLKGANDAGADVENVFLAEKEIKPCKGCFGCWVKTPGKCVIKDDMEGSLSKFMSSDIVVFATPLYADNVTGIMKNFIDRRIPILDPHLEKDEKGECRHPSRYEKSPKIVVISNCGFPEQNHFEVLKLLFRRIARNTHSEVIAEIYRGGGEILKEHPLIIKPFVWKYKKLLRKAGREIVETLKLTEETMSQLEKPIISKEQYINGANNRWDGLLSIKKC
ncbi:MAG: iron-sulfur protein [Candidatus Altiarchaeales archaeon IMC4]|nr:MAG: iron-sulfur protein [Candidatus Altiarchaeales archaeon IMC4]